MEEYGYTIEEFYINYEECKFISGVVINTQSFSFILTMRNVNTNHFVKSIT